MMKNCFFATALFSLMLAVGCAKGGNGRGSGIAVSVSGAPVVGVTLSATYTAAVTGSTNTSVNWSLSGSACTGNPNPCGSFTSTTATTAIYQAPASAPSPNTITITATSQADTTASGDASVNIVPVSVVVTPATSPAVLVGTNLTQQFTAVAVPDAANQTFTWTCSPTAACAGFVPGTNVAGGANTSGVAVYTAPPTPQTGVLITANWSSSSPENPPGNATAKVSVVSSRLASGNYSFQFTGFGSSGKPVFVTGNIVVGLTGAISGFEDVLTPGVSSSSNSYNIVFGSFSQLPNSGNFNNGQGTLTLTLGNSTTNQYAAVITAAGNIQMIESDNTGVTGSGVMQKSSAQFNSSAQTYAFGFTGVDSNGNRVGYAGLLPMTPNANSTGGTISGGMLDTNDNGSTSSVCGASPCTVTGSYQQDATVPGLWHMPLTAGTTALNFDFFVSGGQTQTKTGANPLTLYATSTDTIQTNPAVSGAMIFQVPMTYDNTAFKNSSVSALTGVTPTVANSSNVALVSLTTDGTSSGTGGSGGFTGSYDQNSNGTIASSTFPTSGQSPSPYAYVAGSGNNGRYIFQMPGTLSTSPGVQTIPFVLYASGANRGFWLDQSSTAVLTGTMRPQSTLNNFAYAPTEMPGLYAASTTNGSSESVTPFVENLLLSSTGSATYLVAGTEDTGNGNQLLAGSYTMNSNGTGTINLTTPPAPAVATNVIYAADVAAIPNSLNSNLPNYTITDFFMIGTASGTPSAIIFAQQ